MKTHLLAKMSALSAFMVLITACSGENDVATPEKVDNSIISFNAIAPRTATRTASTTTASLKEFYVYAYTDKKQLMSHVQVTRDGSSWTYSPAAYWPDSPVNFYAFSPDISQTDDILGNGTENINMYDNPGNVDLLYAVNIGEIQKGTPVLINFRHALSRVDILLSSNNSQIDVKISKVAIGNIYNIASFKFPQATTSASAPENVGKWITPHKYGSISIFDAASSPVSLTPEAVDINNRDNETSFDFFIPQELIPLSYDSANKRFVGSHIVVECEIFDKATGAKLFPNNQTPDYLKVEGTETGRIMYPATGKNITEWKTGYSYTYNIAIDNPAVLFDGIDFNVTVDEYNDGGQEEFPGM